MIKNSIILIEGDFLVYDEGLVKRNGENLPIQCLLCENQGVSAVKIKNQKHADRIFHHHKYIELVYMLEGKINAFVEDECFEISKNDIIVIFDGEPHDFLPCDEKGYRYVVSKFLPDILYTREQTVSEFEYILNMRGKGHTRVLKNCEEIGKYVVDAYENFINNAYTSELLIRADIIRVCAIILSTWKKNGEIVTIRGSSGKGNIGLIQALSEKTRKLCGEISTKEASEFCNFSEGHFTRVFKSVMGMSFTEYKRGIKVEEAQRLLKCTDKSITYIAQELGYSTASHFIKDFKKEKGISPRLYRIGLICS